MRLCSAASSRRMIGAAPFLLFLSCFERMSVHAVLRRHTARGRLTRC